ncbi:MAG: HD domain-containing protein [Firmicutes bacterium]|nr:HD domain-containing protein [Bacillota bacterium]
MDPVIEKIIAYAQKLFADNSGGHGFNHTMRVYRNAMKIAKTEPGADKETVALAALLHDADDYKLFQTENNANARRILAECGLPQEKIEMVCDAVNAVSFSKNRDKRPETPEACIVQDADRLDAIGAVGIARTFAYGGEHGRSMEDSVAHFHEKLLLLKDLMNTESAKKLAEMRHAFLEDFLEELSEELGEEA